MQDFKNIRAWKEGRNLVLDIYATTRTFPDSERYGFTQQLRRPAVSITSNLAEGSSRNGDAEFRRFVFMSLGSTSEMESLLILARDLKFLDRQDFERLSKRVEGIRCMLCGLVDALSGEANGRKAGSPAAGGGKQAAGSG